MDLITIVFFVFIYIIGLSAMFLIHTQSQYFLDYWMTRKEVKIFKTKVLNSQFILSPNYKQIPKEYLDQLEYRLLTTEDGRKLIIEKDFKSFCYEGRYSLFSNQSWSYVHQNLTNKLIKKFQNQHIFEDKS